MKAVAPDKSDQQSKELLEAKGEILRLRTQVRRVEEERDLLKKSRAVLCQGPRVKYRFMIEHRQKFAISLMCRVLRVARAGFYEWLRESVCDRAKEDARLLVLIRASYMASRRVYGARRVFGDPRKAGESCGLHRVERLMRRNKIKAIRGYKSVALSVEVIVMYWLMAILESRMTGLAQRLGFVQR